VERLISLTCSEISNQKVSLATLYDLKVFLGKRRGICIKLPRKPILYSDTL
jgi:hypothetical protein